ncbi:Hsp20/alpha crystallin family protein [Myxococcota bacterium]
MFGEEFKRAKNIDWWRELNRLQEELNRLFGGVGAVQVGGFPNVNVWTGEVGALVTADLPGLVADNLEISVLDDRLTLRGKRDEDAGGDGGTFHRCERFHGEFERTVELPFKVDPDKVTAKYKQGVLHVTLPRFQPDKARRVNVEVD